MGSVLGLAISFGGWLALRRAEHLVLTGRQVSCDAASRIELRGRVFETCSSVAANYHAGVLAFGFGWFVLLCCILVLRLGPKT